jgi:hypothetical protein
MHDVVETSRLRENFSSFFVGLLKSSLVNALIVNVLVCRHLCSLFCSLA